MARNTHPELRRPLALELGCATTRTRADSSPSVASQAPPLQRLFSGTRAIPAAPPGPGPASLRVRAPRGGASARYCHGDGKPAAVVAAPPRRGGCEPAETQRGRAAGPPDEKGARTRPAAASQAPRPGVLGARRGRGGRRERLAASPPCSLRSRLRGPAAAQRPPPAPPAASSAPRGNGRQRPQRPARAARRGLTAATRERPRPALPRRDSEVSPAPRSHRPATLSLPAPPPLQPRPRPLVNRRDPWAGPA